jgi:hypothetical protein
MSVKILIAFVFLRWMRSMVWTVFVSCNIKHSFGCVVFARICSDDTSLTDNVWPELWASWMTTTRNGFHIYRQHGGSGVSAALTTVFGFRSGRRPFARRRSALSYRNRKFSSVDRSRDPPMRPFCSRENVYARTSERKQFSFVATTSGADRSLL